MAEAEERGLWAAAKRYWPIVGLPGLVLVVALVGSQLVTVEGSQLVDEPAADFTLPVMAGPGADAGERISLEGLRGSVVLLDFWATWCPPCRQSIPILSEIQERYADRGVQVVGVNLEPELDRGALGAAHHRFGASFPSVQDRSGELQAAYKVTQLPTLFLIGPDGVIRRVEVGVPDEDALQEEIESLIK